jgi:hypothetical protein
MVPTLTKARAAIGLIRDAMTNSGVGQHLAGAIFHLISSAKSQRKQELEAIKISVQGNSGVRSRLHAIK